MKSYLNGGVTKFASVVIGLSMLVAMPVAAQSTQDQINALLAQITALQGQLLSLQGSSTTNVCNFTLNLSMGMSHSQVKTLQQFLNSHGATVSVSGAGSAGNETSYFGAKTKVAVTAWQKNNSEKVLVPAGLTAATGFWGSFSRAYANSMCGTPPSVITPPPGTTPPPATGGVFASAGTQPANSLAPVSATRVKFTNFTVMAGGPRPTPTTLVI